MRIHTAVFSSLTLGALSAAPAQVTVRAGGGRGMAPAAAMALRFDSRKAVIGVTTSTNTGPRDTLGLLVSNVTRNGPADKAGIEEGNRIAAVNGVSLKLAAADLNDPDMESLMSRRLVRELDKLNPGDEVDLRVYTGGSTKSIKVKTISPDSMANLTTSVYRKAIDERPTLGLGIGSSGSKRDTLGIFIMSVSDSGPAAKAGIEEGQRIAAINGVDVRVGHDDAGDDIVSSARMNRFERELQKTKPGDVVTLRIYSNGQNRDVKVTVAAASTLRRNGMTIIRSMPSIRPPSFEFDGDALAATVERAAAEAKAAAGARMDDMSRVFEKMGRTLDGMGSIHWFDEESPKVRDMTAPKPAPEAVRKLVRTISM